MGATTAIRRLHWATFQDEVAPALRASIAGSGVPMFGDCDLLRGDLGVRDDDKLLLETHPHQTGGCRSTTCSGRTACPLHLEGQQVSTAEMFMTRFCHAFETRCCGEPTWLGRGSTWFAFARWFAMENGRDEANEAGDEIAATPVLGLLLRLSKRGAGVGWADGGYGEGILGWLSPEETAALVAALDLVALPPSAPVPAALRALDGYMADVVLPESRRSLALLRDVARQAVAEHDGVALTRS